MVQPRFTWWPWRIVALAVPWVAFAGAAAVAYQTRDAGGDKSDTQVLRALLALYAGGNGLLLGAAIGDLGRSLLALFVGTATALLLAPFCASALAWVCVPLVVGSYTGCLALEMDLDGVVGAMLAGMVDFALGLGVGILVFAALMIVSLPLGLTMEGQLPAFVVATGLGNLVFVGRMFGRAHRVRGAESAETFEPGALDPPADASGEREEDVPGVQNEPAAENPPPPVP